jgi:hypothetical protein
VLTSMTAGLLLLVTAAPAGANDCAYLTDCSSSAKVGIAAAAALAFGLLLVFGIPELVAAGAAGVAGAAAGAAEALWENVHSAAAAASAAQQAADDAAASAATLAKAARDGKVAPSLARLAAAAADKAEAAAKNASEEAQAAEQASQAGDVAGGQAAAAEHAKAAQDWLVEAYRQAILAQIPAVNPTGVLNNCGFVAYAEYQVFGGDATAHAEAHGGLSANDIAAVVGGQFQKTTPRGIENALRAAGDGSGGFVHISWSGVSTYTHMIYVRRAGGTTFYVDGQDYRVATSLHELYPHPDEQIDGLEWMPTRPVLGR